MIYNNILITGKSGFLGSVCYKHLIISNLVDSLGRDNENTIQFSLTNPKININKTYDLVIHIAGKAHIVPKTAAQKKEFFNVNVVGTQNLLLALEKAPYLPKSFVFISSVSVYGLDKGDKIKENHPLNANTPYGLSKVQAEEIVLNWCKKNNIICTILRLPLLVGKNPPGNLGSMIKGIKRGYYMNIAGGKARKSMVMVEDVAKIILPASKIGGIYNLTDGYHPNFRELSATLANQLNKSEPINIPNWLAMLIAKVGDFMGKKAPFNSYKLSKISSNLTFDDIKAREAFGWQPHNILKKFKVN
jgi:nucleoside-diphosphate-sugar epimerase